ncbi:hypothetical protein E2C01_094842 [Portunus trituberculatus]|uniref:Uncharacterized protein n=1 Tax=Portunus trituberculatus TaxID=210409 RepID=A0A5B7JX84_PORTR|nr:hypothetical protein [Portunus trituberculatus]
MCRSGRETRARTGRGLRYSRGTLCLHRGVAAVKALLAACSQDFTFGGNHYYKISSRRIRQKEVRYRSQLCLYVSLTKGIESRSCLDNPDDNVVRYKIQILSCRSK